ncbi:MAG: hypothetical protein KBG49_07415 [Spirochaetes bacterium]|nr:hypothetical protein [Spirochaetota bacterium]
MEIIKKVFSNGFMLFLPMLIWNILFTKYLPPPYGEETFGSNIPAVISIGELVMRICICGLPIIIQLNFSGTLAKAGIIVYVIGMLLYFLSWVLLIVFPQSIFSKSIIGFTASTYTPLIWLIGFTLLSDSFYFKIPYSRWYFFALSVLFIGFHFSHAVIVWNRVYH